jgi:hypothetical protein
MSMNTEEAGYNSYLMNNSSYHLLLRGQLVPHDNIKYVPNHERDHASQSLVLALDARLPQARAFVRRVVPVNTAVLCSTFQVLYDDEFQHYTKLDLNYDFQLAVPEQYHGRLFAANYSSPGSTVPAQHIQNVAV